MNRLKDNLQYWIAFLQDQQKRGNTPELRGKQQTGFPNFLQVGMAALNVPWYAGLKVHLCTSYNLESGDDRILLAELQKRFSSVDGNKFTVASARKFSSFIVTCEKRVYTPRDFHDIAVRFCLIPAASRRRDRSVFRDMQYLEFPFYDGGRCATEPLESLRQVLGNLIPRGNFALKFIRDRGKYSLAVGIRQARSMVA